MDSRPRSLTRLAPSPPSIGILTQRSRPRLPRPWGVGIGAADESERRGDTGGRCVFAGDTVVGSKQNRNIRAS